LPETYTGPIIDWSTNDIALVDATKKAKRAGVISRTGAGSTVNSGFVQASLDTATFTSEEIKYAGHTFGLYGQGNYTMPQNGTAFRFSPPETNGHGMMVSIFPYDGNSVGLTFGQEIKLKFSAVTWRNNSLTNPLDIPT